MIRRRLAAHLAVLVVGGSLAALAAGPRSASAAERLIAAARVLAAVLVLTGVFLIIDGIRDV